MTTFRRLGAVQGRGVTIGSDVDAPLPSMTTKRALLVTCRALERAFQGADDDDQRSVGIAVAEDSEADEKGLLIASFQRREYFEAEAARYAALADSGHTIIVTFTGSRDAVPAGVTAVSLPAGDVRARDWALTVVRGSFAATLTARDLHQLSPTEATLEASRLFMSWSSLRRHLALKSARDHLEGLAELLPPEVLTRAQGIVDASVVLPVSRVEDRLARAADDLLTSLDTSHERAAALRLELESTKSLAERDQLTGLHNRHYLERFLGSSGRPTDLTVFLIDVDDLRKVNNTYGHQAGDAVLECLATTLRANTRAGDVLIRWGGDEFLLLVPYLDAAAGLRHGDRLARAIGAARAVAPWEHLVVSASIGVSPTRRASLPMAQLDAALHHVKRTGKGRASLPPE